MPDIKPHLSHPKYRPEIDGLRAIAVLAVVAFHAFPNWMKGGFIGVDVFFVISGYLISTILFENLDRGTFSFAEFYCRRIRRIFPALILVLVSCSAFGWFALFADEYKQLGKYIAAGAGFVSNLVLWADAGYFDNSAETKPLLHLWSLGIEEQFYIFWPLVLWFAWKRKFNLLTITIAVAAISFALNLHGVKQDAVATFYSPQTRFWELLAGSLLAWFTLYRKGTHQSVKPKIDSWLSNVIYLEKTENNGASLANFLSVAGLALLAYGFWRINKDSAFPGGWAVIPVAGSLLIITAGAKAWINCHILSNRIAVWFGLISFPLYLWHWPLLSFARIIEGGTPSREIRIGLVLLAILLAWITCRLIERPIRLGGRNKIKVSMLIFFAAILGVSGFAANKSEFLQQTFLQQRFDTILKTITRTARQSECFEIPYSYRTDGAWYCDLGNKSFPTEYFAFGDSHALSLVPALESFATKHRLNIQFTGTSGCPPLLGIQSMRGDADIEKNNCQKLNERVFNHVKSQHIQNVILIARWVYYTGSTSRPSELNLIARNPTAAVTKVSSGQDFSWALQNTIARYKSIGVNIILVEDNPQQELDPKDALRKGLLLGGHARYFVSRESHIRNQRDVNTLIRNQTAVVINFDDVLCDDKTCPLFRGDTSLYFDDDHLSNEGAMLVHPQLESGLKTYR